MKKEKIVNRVAVLGIVIALIFSLVLVYFPDIFKLEEASINFSYEDELFDETKIMTVEIQMDEDDWQDMLENAINEEYYTCDIVVNGETFKNVGIRPKGNTSLSQVYSDDTTDRYSFKVEFDHYVDNQTCYGLDKLVLNNLMSDATYMKEYISYDIMSYLGVPSSLYSFANISVNGETWGLYLAFEGVEESFAQRNFGSAYGNLYKPEGSFGMGSNKGNDNNGGMNFEFPNDANEGATQDENDTNQTYTNQASVENGLNNQTDTPIANGTDNQAGTIKQSAQGEQNSERAQFPQRGGFPENSEFPQKGNGGFQGGFGGGMGSSSGGEDLAYVDDEISSYSTIFDSSVFDTTDKDYKRVIEALKNLSNGTDLETYIDVDEVLRYMASNVFLANDDSYFGTMLHNYYLYEKNGKLSMLPWDYNLAFGGFQSSNATSLVNRPIDTVVSGTTLEARPMIGKLLEVEEYKEQYHALLDELISGYFESGQFEKTISELKTLISPYVENDPTAFYTHDEFKTAVSNLEEFCLLRAESIRGQLDGTIPATEEEQENNEETLIDASHVSIQAMGTQGGGNRGEEGRGEMQAGLGGQKDNGQDVPGGQEENQQENPKGQEDNTQNNQSEQEKNEQVNPDESQGNLKDKQSNLQDGTGTDTQQNNMQGYSDEQQGNMQGNWPDIMQGKQPGDMQGMQPNNISGKNGNSKDNGMLNSNQENIQTTLIITGACTLVMCICIIFAKKYHRRKYHL